MNKSNQRGSITAPLLIISATFIVVIYGLVFMLTNQLDMTFRQTAFDQALYISEAGIQYYRWHLAHSPNDFQDGTGHAGPYEHIYRDAQGNELGKFSLNITAPVGGSTIVTITSTGWVNDYESAKRTVTARYGIPSLTKYSAITNASNNYGANLTINGRVHSNNGIRMDAINNSIVSSVPSNYICGSETGCSPNVTTQATCTPYSPACRWSSNTCQCPAHWNATNQYGCNAPCTWINGTNNTSGCQCPAVWGSGPNFSLWQYPTQPIDFNAITFDLGQMRDASMISPGYHRGASGGRGYHVVYNSNGTFNIYRINSTSSYNGMDDQYVCAAREQRITGETLLQSNVPVPTNSVIFLEDNVWVEGVIKGKTTLTAAKYPFGPVTNILINNNLTYPTLDGQNNLGLIAHDNIYLIRDLPPNTVINAALIAQNGTIARFIYNAGCNGSNSVKNSLTIYGAMIANKKSYWNYGNQSGFTTRTITYDNNLLYNPPPYFPSQGDYEFISWEEIKGN